MSIDIYHTTFLKENDKTSNWVFGASILSKPISNMELATWASFMLYMERKYLPSLPDPCPLEKSIPFYHSRFSLNSSNNWRSDYYKNPYLQEIWDLQLSNRITPEERLTMLSMMDGAYFRLEDSMTLFDAWGKVATNMSERSRRAFNLVISYCQDFIARTDFLDKIAINWNSESQLSYSGKADKEGMFDCHLAFQAIEGSFEDKTDPTLDK